MEEVWTTLKVLDWTAGRFARAGMGSPRLDAQVLLAHALKTDRVGLYTHFDKPLRGEELAACRALIKRRLGGEPVAYLTGEKEVWSLSLAVDERVLVPRPDTETLIEAVLDRLKPRDGAMTIVDVGTGSGAIAIVLARELPAARIIATDISDDALAVARGNIERHGVGDRVTAVAGDLLAPVSQPVDAIVANLPYIPTAEVGKLAAEVKREPRLALDGGEDGLDLIRRLLADAPTKLASDGLLALEHGADQAENLAALIAATPGLHLIETRNDLAGHPRVTQAGTHG